MPNRPAATFAIQQDWKRILRHLGSHAPGATTADGHSIRVKRGMTGRWLFVVGNHVYAVDVDHAYRQSLTQPEQVEVFYKGVRLGTVPGPLS